MNAVVVAVVVVLVLAIVFVATTATRRDRVAAMRGVREARRRDRGNPLEADGTATGREVERAAVLERRAGTAVAVPAAAPPPAPRAPLDDEALGVTRRQFFNRSIVAMFGLGLGGFGAATLGFLWPSLSGGFGSKIRVGKLDDILGQIAATREPVYVAEARSWIAPYPQEALDKARDIYTGGVLDGMEQGVVALYQKCVHLGCRVPWCTSSQWFECPCHGSQYNRVGERKAGPAPRGLDRFGVSVDGGVVVVDTAQVIQGPPIGTNTTGQEQEGPHCA
ncbi:MAG TPA: Rieske 2Fe-2S domain-containing protein [Acidimicrobiales bacterium]|nr:Rieske 2Fe-2S domain-containing protein [Acidimicrobiales bacterium]